MIATAYKHYRIYVTKSSSTSGFTCLNEFELYESVNMNTPNLCIGAITSADSTSNSTTFKASNATDGDQSSAWESSGTMGLGHWLAVELPEPKIIRAIKLNSLKYATEAPGDFKIEGSNNGVVWDTLYTETGNLLPTIERKISLYVSGVSKLDTGERVLRVLVFNWISGQLVKSITPNDNGEWFLHTLSTDDVLVTHIGPVGFEPKTDGPITPYSW